MAQKAKAFRLCDGIYATTPTKTKKQIFFCMITKMGLKPTMYSEEIIANTATLEDLFKEI